MIIDIELFKKNCTKTPECAFMCRNRIYIQIAFVRWNYIQFDCEKTNGQQIAGPWITHFINQLSILYVTWRSTEIAYIGIRTMLHWKTIDTVDLVPRFVATSMANSRKNLIVYGVCTINLLPFDTPNIFHAVFTDSDLLFGSLADENKKTCRSKHTKVAITITLDDRKF